jgi:putative RNA 2'-phosphotransferase
MGRRAVATEKLRGEKSMKQRLHSGPDSQLELMRTLRCGKPVILLIESARLLQAGYPFYFSTNGVWMTREVPPEFLWCNPTLAN